MYYTLDDGREILDGTAGLWCVNAGHCRDEDHCEPSSSRPRRSTSRRPSRWAIRKAFEAASELASIAPEGLDHIFFMQLRFRIGRYRAEDRARLSPRARRRPAHPPDRPRARLSRRRLRRHFGRRHRRQPQAFSARAAGVDHLPPSARHRAATPSRAASPSTARDLADELEQRSSRCTIRPPSPPSSSSRSQGSTGVIAAAARAICKSCARSATSTASC